MAVKGIRGAITIKSNTVADIREAVVELLGQMLKQNNIEIKNISHVIFTMTKDLNAAFRPNLHALNLVLQKLQ